MSLRISADTGGTFTDLVLFDQQEGRLQWRKTASTPADPSRALVSGIDGLAAQRKGGVALLVHGTTVATNAVLQRRGAAVALVTTRGFRDVLQIQRQDRPRLYDLRARRAEPLVPRRLRFELEERILYDGRVRTPLDPAELDQLVQRLRDAQVEAVAVGLLHSYANPAHELQVGQVLAQQLPGVTVCLSHEVVGEHGEYERFSTCAMNAFLQPGMQTYLGRLETALQDQQVEAPLFVMKSNGGVMAGAVAGRQAVHTLLSGPAGGVVAGMAIARGHDNPNLITADMGGTSFDVAVLHQGQAEFARDSEIGGLAVAVPMLNIHTVGAGGGSVAWIDAGGSLRVGPQSAGALPGPASYGRGGTLPTVTDANLVLGRLSARTLLAGQMTLDLEAARRAIHDHLAGPLGMDVMTAAEGVIRVVNATMTRAIRRLSVERGLDPRDFVLCPFGGAGPLHGGELAKEMGIQQTLVPVAPGVTSAVGLLMSNLREDRIATHVQPLDAEAVERLRPIFAQMQQEAARPLAFAKGARKVQPRLGLRYLGQRYELPVAVTDDKLDVAMLTEAFAEQHRRLYGFARAGEPIEICSLWLSVEADLQPVLLPPGRPGSGTPQPFAERTVSFAGRGFTTPVYGREGLGVGDRLEGPAVIEQLDSTTLLWPGQSLHVDPHGQLLLGPIP